MFNFILDGYFKCHISIKKNTIMRGNIQIHIINYHSVNKHFTYFYKHGRNLVKHKLSLFYSMILNYFVYIFQTHFILLCTKHSFINSPHLKILIFLNLCLSVFEKWRLWN